MAIGFLRKTAGKHVPSSFLTIRDQHTHHGYDPTVVVADELHAWSQTGMICATMANVWAGKKGKMLKPENFMPISRRRVDLTPQQTVVAIRSLFGRVKKMTGQLD